MRTIAAASLILVSCTLPVDAQQFSQYWYDGNVIYESCQKGQGMVVGFSVAVAEAAAQNKTACIPVGVQAGQIRDVVCRRLTENPSTRHETGFSLATLAIMAAWPCP